MRLAASLFIGLFAATAAHAEPFQAANGAGGAPELTAAAPANVASPHTAPGWQKVENGACAVWNAEPKPLETAYWRGACPDGVVDGEGVLTWIYRKDGAWIRIDYSGVFRDGRQHGPISTHAGVVSGPYFSG